MPKALEMVDVIIILAITGAAVEMFLVINSSVKGCARENPLIAEVNYLERTLMGSMKETMKENASLQLELVDAKEKLLQTVHLGQMK